MTSAAVAYSDSLKSGMLLRLIDVQVEDLRGCGEAVVARLRATLAAGAEFTRDQKHRRCYEVMSGRERFYIHVLRGAKKVLLLGQWSN